MSSRERVEDGAIILKAQGQLALYLILYTNNINEQCILYSGCKITKSQFHMIVKHNDSVNMKETNPQSLLPFQGLIGHSVFRKYITGTSQWDSSQIALSYANTIKLTHIVNNEVRQQTHVGPWDAHFIYCLSMRCVMGRHAYVALLGITQAQQSDRM